MRRIAIAALAALLAASSFAASADAQGRGRGRGEGRYERGDRGGRFDGPGRGRGRGEARGAPRGYRADPRDFRGGPRDAPPPYFAAPGRSWRQGERLPPMYRGGVVQDPGRYRLRQPPPGYDWVGVGPDIYLVQRSTGMVLDTIPGGY